MNNKRGFFVLAFVLTICFNHIAKAEAASYFRVTFSDGETLLLPLQNEICINRTDDFLYFFNEDYSYEFPIGEIRYFSAENNESLSAPSLTAVSGLWSVFDLDGKCVAQGEGDVDVISLPRGRIYVVRQGYNTYKIIKK